jgi:hypothetical protein
MCGYAGYTCIGAKERVDILSIKAGAVVAFRDTGININDFFSIPTHIRRDDPDIVRLDDMSIDKVSNPDFPDGRLDDCPTDNPVVQRQDLWNRYTDAMKPIVAGSVAIGTRYEATDLVDPVDLVFEDGKEMVPGLASVIPSGDVFPTTVDAPNMDMDELYDALHRIDTAQLRAVRHMEGFDIPMRTMRTWELLHQANSLNLAIDRCERFVISHVETSGAHSSIEYPQYQKTRPHRLEGVAPLYNVSGGIVVVDGIQYTVQGLTNIDGTNGFAVFLDLDTSKPTLKGSANWGKPTLKVWVSGYAGNPSIGSNALYVGEVMVVNTRTMRDDLVAHNEIPDDKGDINYCIMRHINQVCIPYDINTGTLQKSMEQVFEQDVTGLVWYDSATRKFKVVQCSPTGNGVLYMYGNSYIDKLSTRTCDE